MLRYVLRSLYGADYQRRGAKLLGVSGKALSAMLCGGLRVSRAIVQRLEHAYPDRARHRRGELRSLAALIAAAFEAETHGLDRSQELIRLLARAASAAANTHNPHSRETGRFVRRVQVKAPVIAEPLRELAAAPVKKKRVPRR